MRGIRLADVGHGWFAVNRDNNACNNIGFLAHHQKRQQPRVLSVMICCNDVKYISKSDENTWEASIPIGYFLRNPLAEAAVPHDYDFRRSVSFTMTEVAKATLQTLRDYACLTTKKVENGLDLVLERGPQNGPPVPKTWGGLNGVFPDA